MSGPFDSPVSGAAAGPPDDARQRAWRGVQRLLAVRLDNLGDVLMTTPALAALRESLPHAHLTLLTSPGAAAAAAHLPMVDDVWSFAAPWMQRGSGTVTGPANASLGRAEAALVDRLAEGGFDAAVIFTVCTQSALPAALICRMAGIPLRLAHSRENPYGLLSDWVPESDAVIAGTPLAQQPAPARHEVQRQLALVGAVGLHVRDDRLRFAVDPADRARVAQRLRKAGIGTAGPYAVLHPGATAASRRWPAERFGAVAQALAAEGCGVVISGDVGELALVDQALSVLAGPAQAGRPSDTAMATALDADAARAPVLPLAGELGLGELAALIEGARVVVANNSAPAHLAAALGTPVVDLYALTNPQHTPWRVRSRVLQHDVPCRWCLKSVCPQQHHACLLGIEPAEVVRAAFELMHRPASDLDTRSTEAPA